MINEHFKLAVAQLNPTVGDISGNLHLAIEAYKKALHENADLLLLTELFISAYPPEDLVLKPAFVVACEAAIIKLANTTKDQKTGIVIGTPLYREGKLYNAVVLLSDGKIIDETYKFDLPNYGEFDEKRVFSKGVAPHVFTFRGLKFGAPICEDIWNDYSVGRNLALQGAEIILVPNGSPYIREKPAHRLDVVCHQANEAKVPIVYANQIGGQDELVFDGGSFAINTNGTKSFQMKHFEEDFFVSDWHKKDGLWFCQSSKQELIFDGIEADYNACVLGFRDYVNKNRFKDVVLGMSGGIDSALCATIAVDALGAERVRAIMLPYHYTSDESLKDAKECSTLLGCCYETIPIATPVEGFLKTLEPQFANLKQDLTEENLQSRVRGTLLMALSNKFGSMVITTGNKSEVAVGYSTLYGDMNGGFNPIKDLYKMQVYAAANWRNSNKPNNALGPTGIVIPQNIIDKAPSAELREDQKDQDSLPPYPVLDAILEYLIEEDMSVNDIINLGFARETVERVENLLYIAEYKRRQSAPGVKITRKNLGRDRRYPITNRFRDKE